MRKFLLVIIGLTFISFVKANPIATPSVNLSEIYFETDGKWVIELYYSDANQEHMPIDSIWIKSTSGISKVKRFNIIGTSGLIVIRNDSLISNLMINPKGDAIKISYSFKSHEFINEPLVFGDLLSSTMNNPRTGQSIASVPYSNLYSIDKSPTIGAMNDTIGMMGTVEGYIYDKNKNLLSIKSGSLINLETGISFGLKPDGSYSTRLYSKKNHINQLLYLTSTLGSSVNIKPLDVNIVPDSIDLIDIYLLEDLKVGISEIVRDTESLFKIFPNPIHELTFNYEIGIPVKSSSCYFEIIDMYGHRIERFTVALNKGKIDLPSSLKNGNYTIVFIANNRNYGSSKLLIAQ